MRTKSNGGLPMILLGAAAGTFLLVFVPSDAWLNGVKAAAETLSALMLKHILTVLLLLIVPSLWAWLAHRISPWILIGLTAFAFGCGLLLTRDPKSALYAAAFAALPGAGLYGLQKLRLSNFRTAIYESFAVLAALFALVCLRDLIESGDAYKSFRSVIGLYGQVVTDMALSGASTVDLYAELKLTIDAFRTNAEALCVLILLLPAMAAGFSNTLFSHLWNRDGGTALAALPPFDAWRCERWYVIFTACFLFATMLLGMIGMQTANALSGVADVLWRLPCMVAGLSVMRRLGQMTGRKWTFWLTVVLLVLLPPITGTLLAIVGMMASLRKPMNVGRGGEEK